MIKFYKMRITETYIGYEEKDKGDRQLVREIASQLKRECEEAISKMSSHEYLMYLVLKEVEKKENRSIKSLMFDIMFGKPDETFIKMITNSKDTVYMLKEDSCGSEKYYDFTFKRIPFSVT